jgi:MFS transporter, NNP family, nitrate/nitrite transporter
VLGRRWIEAWDPNDQDFWRRQGHLIARRNLVFSIFAEFLGFSVWQLWSTVSTQINRVGFHFSVSQLFWLVAIPGLVGATMRFPYGFIVSVVGGRNWTILSAALLLIPTALLGVLVLNPDTPYWLMLLAAATAGFGGGNFASSMANISYFYPDARKGLALGVNAAGGNLGVAFVQFVVPAAIGLGILGLSAGKVSHPALQWAGFLWLPLIVASVLCAYFLMDNLAVARASLREQAVVLRRKHTWVMSWIYIGTFGSFIGYSAALPLLIKISFPHVNPLQFAFLGPLVGSLARPLGGWLSDRIGGALVTFWDFAVMLCGVAGVLFFLSQKSFPGFLAMFLVLFVTAGIGNGSTFRMIPAIFRTERMREAAGRGPEAEARADREGRKEAATVLGFSGAVGAYGGFLIPQGYNLSISATGGVGLALVGFALFYVTCMALTWWYYMRVSSSPARVDASALARARV